MTKYDWKNEYQEKISNLSEKNWKPFQKWPSLYMFKFIIEADKQDADLKKKSTVLRKHRKYTNLTAKPSSQRKNM